MARARVWRRMKRPADGKVMCVMCHQPVPLSRAIRVHRLGWKCRDDDGSCTRRRQGSYHGGPPQGEK